MRRWYLVTYDISDEKRLRYVFRKMRGFGMAMQYSVFLCMLSDREKALMIGALDELIDHVEDRVMILDVGREGRGTAKKFRFLGRVTPLPEREAVII